MRIRLLAFHVNRHRVRGPVPVCTLLTKSEGSTEPVHPLMHVSCHRVQMDKNYWENIQYLKEKVAAGGEMIITQVGL